MQSRSHSAWLRVHIRLWLCHCIHFMQCYTPLLYATLRNAMPCHVLLIVASGDRNVIYRLASGPRPRLCVHQKKTFANGMRRDAGMMVHVPCTETRPCTAPGPVLKRRSALQYVAVAFAIATGLASHVSRDRVYVCWCITFCACDRTRGCSPGCIRHSCVFTFAFAFAIVFTAAFAFVVTWLANFAGEVRQFHRLHLAFSGELRWRFDWQLPWLVHSPWCCVHTRLCLCQCIHCCLCISCHMARWRSSLAGEVRRRGSVAQLAGEVCRLVKFAGEV